MDSTIKPDNSVKLVDKVKNKVAWSPENLAYYINYFLATVLVGAIGFITADYKLEVLTTAEYWTPIIVTQTAVWLILFTRKNEKIKSEIKINSTVIKNQDNINLLTENILDDDFSIFIAELNLTTKKEAYRNKIKLAIRKLDKRANAKNLFTYQYGTEQEKLKSKYCKKKAQFLLQLSDSYINDNIGSIKVRYNKVVPSMVTNCINRSSTNESEIDENSTQQLIRKFAPSSLMGIIILMVTSVIVPDLVKLDWATIVNISSKLYCLVNAYTNATNFSKDYVDTTVVNRQERAISLIKKYNSWCDKKILIKT
jgi:hypothetical protein